MESLESIRKMDINKITLPISRKKLETAGGKRFMKWSWIWMANLAISLLLLGILLPTASEAAVNPRLRVIERRDTNPPFPFTSYSEESDDSSVTTTGNPFGLIGDDDKNDDDAIPASTTKSVKSSISSSEDLFPTRMTNIKVTKNLTNVKEASSVESETITPTYYDVESSAVEDELSAEGSGGDGTTYTSLLSPVSTTSPSPFSSILMNKTARNFSNRVGIRGLDDDSRNQHNANSVLAADPSVSYRNNNSTTSTNGGNGSLLRAARPTSSVISYNPNTYNRVVKRRKITSISGRNNNMTRNGNSDVTTTPVSYVVTISEEESTTDDTHPSHLQGNTTSSRAIAGFSKGPNKIVTKTRPKPIIIRDHEAYFRNLSTSDSSTTPETGTAATLQDVIEDDTQAPTGLPGAGANVLPSPPFKVRRVKVTMRRPGTVNSDQLPVQQKRNGGLGLANLGVEFVTPPSPRNNSDISEMDSSNNSSTTSGLMADADHQSPAAVEYGIRPSPTLRQDSSGYRFQYTEPAYSSRRVYKEDFGVEKGSYGHHGDDDYSHIHSDHDNEDMEVDATTEQYHSVEPPTGGSSFSIESSMNDDNHPHLGSVRISSPGTPKYRDYFSDIDSGGSGNDSPRDNHNHLYSNGNRDSFEPNGHPQLSSGVTSVTVTVTKTVIHDTPASSLPHDHTHEQSEYNPLFPINQNHQNVEPTPALPFNNNPPASPTFQIRQDDDSKSNVNSANANDNSNAGPVSNSVDDVKISSNGNSSVGASVTNSHTEDGHGHQNVNNGDVNSNSSNQSHNQSNHEQSPNEHQHGNPSINPTSVISSKDIKSVYYTKVVEPHFTSSSYEFTSSKEFSYFIPDPHHHDEEDHAHSHDHEHEVQDVNPTTVKPFWDSSVTLANASSSQTPVIIDQQPGFSTPQIDTELAPPTGITSHSNSTDQDEGSAEISATEQVFPSAGDNENGGTGSGSIEDISGGSKVSNPTADKNRTKFKGEGPAAPKGTPVPNFPVLYQVPILVKMVLEVPQTMFCSHLTNFKQMIVMVYGERHTAVDEDQVVIFTEPNCTSVSNETYTPTNPFDFGSTESSKTSRGRKNNTVLIKPTEKSKIPNTDKNDTSIPDGKETDLKGSSARQKLVPESERKNSSTSSSVLRRRRRSGQKVSLGESLILDRRSNLEDDGIRHSNSHNLTAETDENLSVYFFMNDKTGNYDQELTMAFVALWNKTAQGNGSFFDSFFYQKIRKVDMISSSQLVSPADDPLNENSGIIAAIAIASIAATCLFLIGVLLLVLRHRQAQTKFAKRCTPVTLDDYSLDNISFSNSFRRKQRLRGSKRSYTNAAFDDHNAPSRVVNSATLHAALNDAAALECEFREIPNSSPTLDDIPQGAETKNRYANVIPMPDTRVLMTFQEEQPNSDYINANYVRGPNGEPKRYIITQGPLDETTVDFWRMVWEQQVRVIFMLTDFAEAGIPRCAEYYPRSETIDCSQLHGDYQVTLEKRDITENCITSYLVIKDMERNLRRDVIHLWYHSWPDKGVPSGGKPTADFLLKARKFTKEPTPVLVHCSPGTGRSGTIVACDIAMKEYETQQKVDIPRLLLRIRQDRSGAVQTKDQYAHIYEVLQYYANRISATQMESIP